MPAVLLGGRMTVAAIGLLELLVLFLSLRDRDRRGIGRLTLQILVPGAGAFLPASIEARAVCLILLIWSGGVHAQHAPRALGPWARGQGPWRPALWHAAAGGALAALSLLRLILAPVLLPLLLLLLFLAGLLAAFPLGLLMRGLRRQKSGALAAYTIAFGLLLSAHLWELLSAADLLPGAQLVVPATLLFLGTLFVLLARDSRPWAEGLLGGPGPGGPQAHELRLRQAYSRIVQTEHSLLIQDRLVAAGVLAAGAAHEFKNTLSCILATVEHGLRGLEGAEVSRCLQLAREHAVQGQRVVTELLEGLVRHGREAPERFLLLQGLSSLLELVRAAFRPETILFKVEIPSALEVRTRKGELEQVLLSLIRNAADSVRRQRTNADQPGQIALRARRLEEAVIIDVVDSGGGVPAAVEPRLFQPAVTDKDSTGLGLYLAATLTERNGGSLSYIPVEGGSCFRLTLPAA